MPGLPQFFASYPDIEIAMSESDRWVDLVREGVDCVLRFGALPDSDLVARTRHDARAHHLRRALPISSAMAARRRLHDLASHRAVGLALAHVGRAGAVRVRRTLQGLLRMDVPAPFSVTGTESFLDGVRLGLGLAQMPVFHVERDIAEGRLRRILPEYPGAGRASRRCCIRAAVSSRRACGCSSTGSCSGFRPSIGNERW